MDRRILIVAALLAPGLAGAEMSWRATPEVAVTAPESGHDGHGGHSAGRQRGAPLSFYLRDSEGAAGSVSGPDLKIGEIATAPQVQVRASGIEGYHRLLARREAGGVDEVAMRYFYAGGKRTGNSPADLLEHPATRLEIVPTPLPREHSRYTSGAPARFMVRFEGKPLIEVPVRLVTANGSLLEAITDGEGRVAFTLPDDFSNVRPGRGANAPADFVVSTAQASGDALLRTTLSAEYHVNPDHWQSTWGGLASLAVGFLVGLRVVRPREEQKA